MSWGSRGCTVWLLYRLVIVELFRFNRRETIPALDPHPNRPRQSDLWHGHFRPQFPVPRRRHQILRILRMFRKKKQDRLLQRNFPTTPGIHIKPDYRICAIRSIFGHQMPIFDRKARLEEWNVRFTYYRRVLILHRQPHRNVSSANRQIWIDRLRLDPNARVSRTVDFEFRVGTRH